MTQEDKELLLKDLCGRLPYGVKCYKMTFKPELAEEVICMLRNGSHNCVQLGTFLYRLEHIKPYLFPLSSMTEGQTEEVHNLIYQGVAESIEETKEWLKTRKENELRPITLTYILSYTLVIDWLNKNHFDYRGLIPMGLAIDCTNLNIY